MPWPKAMPVVEVEWIDSIGHHGWQSADALTTQLAKGDPELSVRSCGYLYCEDATHVVLTLGQTAQGQVDSVIQIPRCAVRSITVLRAASPRKSRRQVQ